MAVRSAVLMGGALLTALLASGCMAVEANPLDVNSSRMQENASAVQQPATADVGDDPLNLAENGMSVLFISAELEEVLRLSHRVVVLRDRHVVADLENDGLTFDALLALIADGRVASDDEALDELAPAAASAAAPAIGVPATSGAPTPDRPDVTEGGPR